MIDIKTCSIAPLQLCAPVFLASVGLLDQCSPVQHQKCPEQSGCQEAALQKNVQCEHVHCIHAGQRMPPRSMQHNHEVISTQHTGRTPHAHPLAVQAVGTPQALHQ